ncbi:MAG: hypothetical protein AAGE65_13270 [Planctomycetota bacterium]
MLVLTGAKSQAGTLGPLPHESRIGGSDDYTGFGTYGVSPESPNGQRIIYLKFDKTGLSPTDGKTPAALWVCNADLTGHRKVRDIEFDVRVHNGALQQWVDNDSVAYSGGTTFEGSARVVNIDTGVTEHGPYQGAIFGDTNYDGHLLLSVWHPTSPVGQQGLYELDTHTGNLTLIHPMSFFADRYNEKWDDGTDDPRGWVFAHGRYSKFGKHLAFTISTANEFDRSYGQYGNVKSKQHMFTCKRDGSSIRHWGTDKPMHFDWLNDNNLFGSDIGVENDGHEGELRLIKSWTRGKVYRETLGGLGCHIAQSPDARWFAGESWYGSKPVEFWIYARHNTTPAVRVFRHEKDRMTWKKHKAHVNPAFSRDSQKIYYKRPINEDTAQAFVVRLEDLGL